MSEHPNVIDAPRWDPGELLRAYRALDDSATGPHQAPTGGQWPAEWVLAHLVATNRILCAAVSDLLEGGVPVVDNRSTHSPRYLTVISSVAGESLRRLVAGSAEELVALADQLDAAQLATPVPAILADGGRIRTQHPVPFASLLSIQHVMDHLDQLRRLAVPPPGSAVVAHPPSADSTS